MAETKRRARGEDSIYYDRSRNRWTGTITVGWKPDGRRDRITVRGRTKTELRHTFVSLLSDSGIPIEQIADAVGHSSTRTTEVVYRHQLRPVTRTAAVALGPLFESNGKTDGGQS